MGYIGNTPALKYASFAVQHFTTSATTTYTLDNPVANENEIALFINNVRQEPGSSYAYTASGTTLTLSAATSASDTMYCVFIGKAVQTVTPANGSVTGDMMSYPLTNFSSTGIDDNATSTAVTIDSSGKVGIGTTSPQRNFHIHQPSASSSFVQLTNTATGSAGDSDGLRIGVDANRYAYVYQGESQHLAIGANNSEKMRVHSNGVVGFGTTANSPLSPSESFGVTINDNISGGHYLGVICASSNGSASLFQNRGSDDGVITVFRQANSTEGTISVSGSTINYNGFTGTHWSRLSDNSKPTILKGTILESLDEMMDWYQVQFDIIETDDEGNETTKIAKQSYALGNGESVGDVITYNYEGTDYQATIIQEDDVKHVKAKISDTVDAKNVYGVFVSWDNDDDTVNDMYVAQTGTFVVRMNSAETVSKGDLIQSNGDGTGKVQADDIIRASTVAKVLSTTKIETYEDGSYIVPCSLHC